MTQKPIAFPLAGGLDLVTPAVAMPPGRCIAALNYEPTSSGYRRLGGFERFDGSPAPSDATYWRIDFDDSNRGSGATAPSPGDILTCAGPVVPNPTAVIIDIVASPADWSSGSTSGYIVVACARGDLQTALFDTGNNNITGTISATIEPTLLTENYDFGAAQNAIYQAAAAEACRTAIDPVPGSGPVRGIAEFQGEIIAIRDDAGATEGRMHRSTIWGWEQIGNFTRLDFEGDTDDGDLSELSSPGAQIADTASSTSDGTIVQRAVQGDASNPGYFSGFMLLSNYNVGAFVGAGETIYEAGSTDTVGTTTAAPMSVTFPPGGRYFFLKHNFYGASDRTLLFAVNGVGPALTYDGDSVANIITGMDDDRPNRIAEHKNALFLSFPGGSVQFSTVGEPYIFNPILGAGEFGVGSDVTDLISANKTTLGILAEGSINVLYGSDSTDYVLETLTSEAGARPFTAQKLGQVLYMDNVGIRTLAAARDFGNFNIGTISRLVEPLLRDYRTDGVEPVASFIHRRADQFWLFFDNGTGLIIYLGKKQPEIMPFNLGFTVTCASSIEDNEGVERLFVGTDDGYVMELERGTSFDGEPIEHYFRLPFNHFGAPKVEKRAHKVIIDLEANGPTTLTVSVDLDYGAVEGYAEQTLSVTTGGGALDDLGTNELYFASQIETLAEAYIDGVACNYSLKVGEENDDERPHTATGVTYYISPRRLKR